MFEKEQGLSMYRTAVIFVLLFAALFIVLHFLFVGIRRIRSPLPGRTMGWFERLVYAAVVLSAGALAFTAFVSIVRAGHMGGWMLWWHLGIAAVFVAALPLMTLAMGEDHLWRCGCSTDGGEAMPRRFTCGAKMSFWVIVAGGLVTMGSMLANMLPLNGTEGQRLWIAVHRWSALAVVVAVVLHLYLVLVGRRARR